ncbi:MAG: V-type ATP synthase subunit F [Eubacterium sp.]|nr:V-type ATP synthase subunit F [Eubacterium sp.]
MYKAAVMGDYDSIYGFATIGLETFAETDPDKASETLDRLAQNEFAVVYITESLAAKIQKTIDKYKETMLPSIILIPGISDNTGAGVEGVKKSVEQAIGSDILFGSNQ